MRASMIPGRISGALVLTTSIALGTAGAVVAYRVVAGPAPGTASVPPALAAPAVAAEQDPPEPIVKLAPCRPPAVLERGACVTEVVREVVVPAPARAVPGAAGGPSRRNPSGAGERGEERRSASAGGSQDGDRSGDDREDDRRDDRGDDREDRDGRDHEDRDDEDHEDEDHEDEDHEEHEDD